MRMFSAVLFIAFVLVAPQEKGDPLTVTGVVRDETGQPIPGASLYVFQADAVGFYSAEFFLPRIDGVAQARAQSLRHRTGSACEARC